MIENNIYTYDGVDNNPRITNTSYSYDDYGNVLRSLRKEFKLTGDAARSFKETDIMDVTQMQEQRSSLRGAFARVARWGFAAAVTNGGIRGFNKSLIEDALINNLLKENIEIKLYGYTLFDALYYSIDPYFSGISGNKEEIKELLEKLKLKDEASVAYTISHELSSSNASSDKMFSVL